MRPFDAAERVHQQLFVLLELVFGLAKQVRGVVGLVGHVDDDRLVFDIVVEEAVDQRVVLAGQRAAVHSLLHLEVAGRRESEAQRMADIAPPSRHRWRGHCRESDARESGQGRQTHSLPPVNCLGTRLRARLREFGTFT
jgi:hypothetical protein